MAAHLKLSTWPSHVARKTRTLGRSHGKHSFSTPELTGVRNSAPLVLQAAIPSLEFLRGDILKT
jgi:hypothetical protein